MNILGALHALVPKLSEHIVAWGVVLGGATSVFVAIGWDLPPFSSMNRVKELAVIQTEMQAAQTANVCIMLDIQRTALGIALRNSEMDLKKNPESESAAVAVDTTRQKIRQNRKNIQALGPRCPI